MSIFLSTKISQNYQRYFLFITLYYINTYNIIYEPLFYILCKSWFKLKARFAVTTAIAQAFCEEVETGGGINTHFHESLSPRASRRNAQKFILSASAVVTKTTIDRIGFGGGRSFTDIFSAITDHYTHRRWRWRRRRVNPFVLIRAQALVVCDFHKARSVSSSLQRFLVLLLLHPKWHFKR